MEARNYRLGADRFRLLTFVLVLAAVAPLLGPAQEQATAPPLAENPTPIEPGSVEFKADAGGAVTEVVFRQPNGTFTAKKK